MDAQAEAPRGNSAQEPSKWNLLAWIWWRLGEDRSGEPELYFTSTSMGDWWIPVELVPGADGGWQDGYDSRGSAERSNGKSSGEPSKWSPFAWIWWKLGEPPPDDGSRPIFSSLDEYSKDGYRP